MGQLTERETGGERYENGDKYMVLLPNNGVITFNEKTEAGTLPEHFSEMGAPADNTTSVYQNIKQGQTENNGESGKNGHYSLTDEDYLDAVDRGDMETAARMVEEAAKADCAILLQEA